MLAFKVNEDNGTSLVFHAAFHLGFPFAVVPRKRNAGWKRVRSEIVATVNRNDDFELSEIDSDPENKFPLGLPVFFKYRHFFNVFNIDRDLGRIYKEVGEKAFNKDHVVWVLPTGVVLLTVKYTIADKRSLDLEKFEEIVENNYANLACVYILILGQIISDITDQSLKDSIYFHNRYRVNQDGFNVLNEYGRSEGKERKKDFALGFADSVLADPGKRAIFEQILIDVYYFRVGHEEGHVREIGYVHTLYRDMEPDYFWVISIAYSSFVNYIWIVKFLSELCGDLQNALFGGGVISKNTTSEIKILRIMALQFINESTPINIRLTGIYMECLEECVSEFRMDKMSSQLNDQLSILDSIFCSIEDIFREERNVKIAVAAFILSLVSIAASAASIISTVDYLNKVSVRGRLWLIGTGFAFGIICTIGVLVLPIRKMIASFSVERKPRRNRKHN